MGKYFGCLQLVITIVTNHGRLGGWVVVAGWWTVAAAAFLAWNQEMIG